MVEARQQPIKPEAGAQAAEQLWTAVTVATERSLVVVEHAATKKTAAMAECMAAEAAVRCTETVEMAGHMAAVEALVRTIQVMPIMAVQVEYHQVVQVRTQWLGGTEDKAQIQCPTTMSMDLQRDAASQDHLAPEVAQQAAVAVADTVEMVVTAIVTQPKNAVVVAEAAMELMAVIAGGTGLQMDRNIQPRLAAEAAVDMVQWDAAEKAAEAAARMDQAAMGIKTDSMVEVAGLEMDLLVGLIHILAQAAKASPSSSITSKNPLDERRTP